MKPIKSYCLLSVSAIFILSDLFASHPSATVNTEIPNNTFKNITVSEMPTVGNTSEYAAETTSESEKILVVLVDAYGTEKYSKIVITDVDMELSIFIAKDMFETLAHGIYTVVASSANDLVSQKLIIQ